MPEKSNIVEDLARWFESGDELAHRRAYEYLKSRLVAEHHFIRVLSGPAVDEIRHEALIHLLDLEPGRLAGVKTPVRYAKVTFERMLVDAMRKWGPRGKRTEEVHQHITTHAWRDDVAEAEARMDADRALEVAASLPGKGRLAILLRTRPERITDKDWQDLVASLPPPPPDRPQEALSREEASRLLYPPDDPESKVARYQRINSFDKAFSRAAAKIREALKVTP